VARNSPLHLDAVRQLLAGRFGAVEDVTPFGGGAWSHAFGFRAAGRDLVARFGSFPHDYEKDSVAASWRRAGLPVPEVLEIGEAFGLYFTVSQRVFGTPLEDLDAQSWRAVPPSLFRALEAMQSIELAGTGFGGWAPDGTAPYASWPGWLLAVGGDQSASRIHGWRERLASVPGAVSRFDECYELLVPLAARCPNVRRVVHGDLTAGNVLVDDGHITGVFDWANSIAGDPLYDIAWLTFWAPHHPGVAGIDLRRLAQEHLDAPDFEDRVRCYEVHIGLDAQKYNAWTSRWDQLESAYRRTVELVTR
jgi:hygromycin-B 4-O-kinase